MKKVLVTGATGFLGRHVIADLVRDGHSVIATASGKNSLPNELEHEHVRYLPLDLRAFDKRVDYFRFFDSPDKMIHLAWEGLPNYKQAFHFEENLLRHYFLLKNLIDNGCHDLTVTGTCFEYGKKEGELIESIPADPDNSYALAKDCLHKFLIDIGKTNPFSLKWARLFYLFGKGQSDTSLIGQLEKALREGATVFHMSPGLQQRDYLPVELAASYVNRISLQNNVVGTINCCSGKPVTVREMVERYLQSQDKKIELDLGFYPYPDYEAMAFWGNTNKLQTALHE